MGIWEPIGWWVWGTSLSRACTLPGNLYLVYELIHQKLPLQPLAGMELS